MSRNVLQWLLGVVLCFVVGCGGDDASSTTTTTDTTAGNAPEVPGGSPGAPSSSSPTSSANLDTPDGVIQALIDGVKNNQLGVVWDVLPASYQQDVNTLFRDFGGQVDAELWDKLFATLNRYVSVTMAKQDMILQTPSHQQQMQQTSMMMTMMNVPDVGLSNPEVMKKLSSLGNEMGLAMLNSDLSSAEKLKNFDGKKFFSTTLSQILKKVREAIDYGIQLAKQNRELMQNPQMSEAMALEKFDINTLLSQMQVKTESQEGDNAMVSVTIDGRPVQIPMMRVEGKWLPAPMVAFWGLGMSQAKAQVPELAGMVNAMKGQIMPSLETVDPLIEELQKASTQEEFNVAYDNLETTLKQTFGGAPIPGVGGIPGMSSGGGGTVVAVTVTVDRTLSDEETAKVIEELEALSDNPAAAITLPKVEGGATIFEITPVGNVQQFADGIKFGTVQEVDSLGRSVRVQMQ